MTPTCKTCLFRPNKTCRRYPPGAAVGAPAIWPVTQDEDWCGEHKAFDAVPTAPVPAPVRKRVIPGRVAKAKV